MPLRGTLSPPSGLRPSALGFAAAGSRLPDQRCVCGTRRLRRDAEMQEGGEAKDGQERLTS